MRFSIIVPVFNAEEYLPKTINSILNQSFKNFEVILIDDGSSDNSATLCDDFFKIDSRIKVFHKENEGVSSARNLGIKKAKGEYLFFIDADDLLPLNALFNINKKIDEYKNEIDIIFANYKEIYSNQKKNKDISFHYDKKIEKMNANQIFYYLYGELIGFGKAVWSHTYKAEIIKKKLLYFDENLTVNEDGDWLFKIILESQKFGMLNECTYFYRKDNLQSAVNKIHSYSNYQSCYQFYTTWFELFKNKFGEKKTKDVMLDYLAQGFINSGIIIFFLNDLERKQASNLFREKVYILKYSKRHEHYLLFGIYRFLGVEKYLFFLNFLYRTKRKIKCSLVKETNSCNFLGVV